MSRTKRNIKPRAVMARIIHDSADASKDKFMPLADAKALYAEGKLDLLDMGPSYPNSYAPLKKEVV